MRSEIVDVSRIFQILKETANPEENIIREILKKAGQKKGLSLADAGYLVNCQTPRLRQDVFSLAAEIKKEIYGERLVFFAPLYVSDFCVNDCAYCNFHIRNQELKRKKLSLIEVAEQTRLLINMGHKRLLLEFGESPFNDIDYVVSVIRTIYSVQTKKGNIRRVNVNIAATTEENYRRLKSAGIGTYQLFQETYNPEIYARIHRGPKADYDRQITAHDRAFAAGLDDLGVGVLFGLYDWRFEVLGLLAHSQYLEKRYGVGPHTISVPRFRPAPSVDYQPDYPVSDADFLYLIAVLRLAVPYTGMILSTREKPEIRQAAFRIGISQASAASVTEVGGYGQKQRQGQFQIFDERSLNEVIAAALADNLLPSFCTACYRRGRTGQHFMELAKPGEIHQFCRPNGLLTFAEYLQDFADQKTYEAGQKVIEQYLQQIENPSLRQQTRDRLEKIKHGERDLYF